MCPDRLQRLIADPCRHSGMLGRFPLQVYRLCGVISAECRPTPTGWKVPALAYFVCQEGMDVKVHACRRCGSIMMVPLTDIRVRLKGISGHGVIMRQNRAYLGISMGRQWLDKVRAVVALVVHQRPL